MWLVSNIVNCCHLVAGIAPLCCVMQTIVQDKYVFSDYTAPPYPCLLNCSVVLFGSGSGIVIVLCLVCEGSSCLHVDTITP